KELKNQVVLSAGNILREMCSKDEYKHLKPILDSGGLVATDLICEILVKKAEEYNYNIFIDGFPRTIEQAIMIKDFMNKNNISCKGIFVVEVPEFLLYERTMTRTYCNFCYYTNNESIECCSVPMTKRNDDNFETLSKRIKIFYENIYKILHIMEGPIYFIDNHKNINETIKNIEKYI
ncbi:MAG: nucleoside monophosphate kinase, partial [Bacteroidota bacterium]